MTPKGTVNVTILLKNEQRRDMNKWACTIRGEDRLVTQSSVSFFHPSLEGIHETFDESECESFVIKSY